MFLKNNKIDDELFTVTFKHYLDLKGRCSAAQSIYNFITETKPYKA